MCSPLSVVEKLIMNKLIVVKAFLFFMLFGWFAATGYAQYVHFGFPDDSVKLRKGDMVVTNIPSFYMTGYWFVHANEVDEVADFLKKHDTLTFQINVHYALGMKILLKEISSVLGEHLDVEMQRRSVKRNYQIESMGNDYPLYHLDSNATREERIRYEYYNTRLEFIVK